VKTAVLRSAREGSLSVPADRPRIDHELGQALALGVDDASAEDRRPFEREVDACGGCASHHLDVRSLRGQPAVTEGLDVVPARRNRAHDIVAVRVGGRAAAVAAWERPIEANFRVRDRVRSFVAHEALDAARRNQRQRAEIRLALGEFRSRSAPPAAEGRHVDIVVVDGRDLEPGSTAGHRHVERESSRFVRLGRDPPHLPVPAVDAFLHQGHVGRVLPHVAFAGQAHLCARDAAAIRIDAAPDDAHAVRRERLWRSDAGRASGIHGRSGVRDGGLERGLGPGGGRVLCGGGARSRRRFDDASCVREGAQEEDRDEDHARREQEKDRSAHGNTPWERERSIRPTQRA
jgi:hypothetical protein